MPGSEEGGVEGSESGRMGPGAQGFGGLGLSKDGQLGNWARSSYYRKTGDDLGGRKGNADVPKASRPRFNLVSDRVLAADTPVSRRNRAVYFFVLFLYCLYLFAFSSNCLYFFAFFV